MLTAREKEVLKMTPNVLNDQDRQIRTGATIKLNKLQEKLQNHSYVEFVNTVIIPKAEARASILCKKDKNTRWDVAFHAESTRLKKEMGLTYLNL